MSCNVQGAAFLFLQSWPDDHTKGSDRAQCYYATQSFLGVYPFSSAGRMLFLSCRMLCPRRGPRGEGQAARGMEPWSSCFELRRVRARSVTAFFSDSCLMYSQ